MSSFVRVDKCSWLSLFIRSPNIVLSMCAHSWGITAPGAVRETCACIGGVWVKGECGRSTRESLGGPGKACGNRVVEFTECLSEGSCRDHISRFFPHLT